MPTYEYRCADCGHNFDIFQSFTDDSLTVCPECDGNLKKVFGSVAISFKGPGFYVTDSAAKNPASESAGASSEGGSSSSGSSDSGSSSDTKAATASD